MEWLVPSPSEEIDLGDLGCLLVVADGMGGANAGEVASAIAIDTVQKSFTPDNLKSLLVRGETEKEEKKRVRAEREHQRTPQPDRRRDRAPRRRRQNPARHRRRRDALRRRIDRHRHDRRTRRPPAPRRPRQRGYRGRARRRSPPAAGSDDNQTLARHALPSLRAERPAYTRRAGRNPRGRRKLGVDGRLRARRKSGEKNKIPRRRGIRARALPRDARARKKRRLRNLRRNPRRTRHRPRAERPPCKGGRRLRRRGRRRRA